MTQGQYSSSATDSVMDANWALPVPPSARPRFWRITLLQNTKRSLWYMSYEQKAATSEKESLVKYLP